VTAYYEPPFCYKGRWPHTGCSASTALPHDHSAPVTLNCNPCLSRDARVAFLGNDDTTFVSARVEAWIRMRRVRRWRGQGTHNAQHSRAGNGSTARPNWDRLKQENPSHLAHMYYFTHLLQSPVPPMTAMNLFRTDDDKGSPLGRRFRHV